MPARFSATKPCMFGLRLRRPNLDRKHVNFHPQPSTACGTSTHAAPGQYLLSLDEPAITCHRSSPGLVPNDNVTHSPNRDGLCSNPKLSRVLAGFDIFTCGSSKTVSSRVAVQVTGCQQNRRRSNLCSVDKLCPISPAFPLGRAPMTFQNKHHNFKTAI